MQIIIPTSTRWASVPTVINNRPEKAPEPLPVWTPKSVVVLAWSKVEEAR